MERQSVCTSPAKRIQLKRVEDQQNQQKTWRGCHLEPASNRTKSAKFDYIGRNFYSIKNLSIPLIP